MAQFKNGYALLIGIANYQFINNLPDTVLHDVQALSGLLTDAQACGYSKNQVKTLLNQEATAKGIHAGLQWLADVTGEEDTAVVYFSGHAGRVTFENQVLNFLLPHDAKLNAQPHKAISSQDLSTLLHRIKAGRLVVLFDCCHAGGIGTPKTPLPASIYKTGIQEHVFEQLRTGKGRVIIASSRPDELSWIHPNMDNSLFTTYLLEGLHGGVINKQYQVLIVDLFNYIAKKVTEKEPHQHPLLKANLENNFPVALASPPPIIIEGDDDAIIPMDALPIFYHLFKGYQKIRLKKQFSRGWSGATVFEIRPFRDGKNSPELNSVIKFGPASLIQEEWNAYQTIVKNKLPKMTHIMGDPVYDSDFRWGILRYPMVGDGIFDVQSLGQRFLALVPDVLGKKIPAWLFPPLEKLWSAHYLQTEYSFREGFAFWLPKNLDEDCSQLKQMAQAAIGNEVNLDAETITLPTEGIRLPNPLLQLPKLLNQEKDVYVSRIHGDLNLENILVIRSEEEYDVQLIDSARAREDYVLHDLLCLETGIWVNIMPQLLRTELKPFALLWQLLVHLHLEQTRKGEVSSVPDGFERPFTFLQVCRGKVYPNLAPIRKWEEYYQGLIIYLLGTLDFDSLDVGVGKRPLLKQIAFWVAAMLLKIMAKPDFTIQDTPTLSSGKMPKKSDFNPQSLSTLLNQIRLVLQECKPFETQRQLRVFFMHPDLIAFRNHLPEEHQLVARVDGTVDLLQNRKIASTQANALVTLLRVLGQDPNMFEDLRPDLVRLTKQLEVVLTSEYPPKAQISNLIPIPDLISILDPILISDPIPIPDPISIPDLLKVNLISEKNVDYTRLRDLLAERKWKEADEETRNVLIKALDLEGREINLAQRIKHIPCGDFRTINQLWIKASNGKFGFSVQKKIWSSIGGPANKLKYEKFMREVGWINRIKQEPHHYADLKFSDSAPKGHLPTVGISHAGNTVTENFVQRDLCSRVESCLAQE